VIVAYAVRCLRHSASERAPVGMAVTS